MTSFHFLSIGRDEGCFAGELWQAFREAISHSIVGFTEHLTTRLDWLNDQERRWWLEVDYEVSQNEDGTAFWEAHYIVIIPDDATAVYYRLEFGDSTGREVE